jgi:hypothetical protein
MLHYQMIDGKHPTILDGFQPSKLVQDFATIRSIGEKRWNSSGNIW